MEQHGLLHVGANCQQPVREATAKRAKYVKEPSPSHVVPLVEFTVNVACNWGQARARRPASSLLRILVQYVFPSPFFAFTLDIRSFHPIRQTLSAVCVCVRAHTQGKMPSPTRRKSVSP